MGTMRISQLAERCGVPATTLRFYESAGLVPAERTAAGYRVYGEDAVGRLAYIGAAKRLGLPLDEIAALLDVWSAGACREVKQDLRPRIAARLAEAEGRAAELAAFTMTLHEALTRLDALPDFAGPCDTRCGFPAPHASSAPEEEPKVSQDTAERWRRAPIACTLAATDLGERADQWRALINDAETTPIFEGLRLTLPAERAASLAALAVAEQECCAFFDFRLQLEVPFVNLDVRAPADAAELLTQLFSALA
jgi:MerR family transcriptional regulator, copper efflux regulator